MVALPAAVLHAAYRADQPVAPDAGTLQLAWRALLTSRALVLFVPAFVRRMGLLPQLGLSGLAFAIAASNVDAICATPLVQHEHVHGLFVGTARLMQIGLHLLLGSQPAASTSACSCRATVLFMQLVIGVALPTLLYLLAESEEAASMTADQRHVDCELSWDQRVLLWKDVGLPPLLFATIATVGACCVLASML
ncbi:hypothetical protein ABPG75_000554 [Micractinium tetrahymenae]